MNNYFCNLLAEKAAWRFLRGAAVIAVAVVGLAAPIFAQSLNPSEITALNKRLFAAVDANNLSTVRTVLTAGASPTAVNEDGLTSAGLAIEKGYFDMAHFILAVRNQRTEARQAEKREAQRMRLVKPVMASPAPAPALTTKQQFAVAPPAPVADNPLTPPPSGSKNPFDPSTPPVQSFTSVTTVKSPGKQPIIAPPPIEKAPLAGVSEDAKSEPEPEQRSLASRGSRLFDQVIGSVSEIFKPDDKPPAAPTVAAPPKPTQPQKVVVKPIVSPKPKTKPAAPSVVAPLAVKPVTKPPKPIPQRKIAMKPKAVLKTAQKPVVRPAPPANSVSRQKIILDPKAPPILAKPSAASKVSPPVAVAPIAMPQRKTASRQKATPRPILRREIIVKQPAIQKPVAPRIAPPVAAKTVPSVSAPPKPALKRKIVQKPKPKPKSRPKPSAPRLRSSVVAKASPRVIPPVKPPVIPKVTPSVVSRATLNTAAPRATPSTVKKVALSPAMTSKIAVRRVIGEYPKTAAPKPAPQSASLAKKKSKKFVDQISNPLIFSGAPIPPSRRIFRKKTASPQPNTSPLASPSSNPLENPISSGPAPAYRTTEPLIKLANLSPRPRIKVDIKAALPLLTLATTPVSKPLRIGNSLRLHRDLGKALAASSKCFQKQGVDGWFCLETADWPSGKMHLFEVNNWLYRKARTIVRYENNVVTRIYSLFPAENFAEIVAYYTNKLGQPNRRGNEKVAVIGAKAADVVSVSWVGASTPSGQPVLELRSIDNIRGMAPDTKVGVLRLYEKNSTPIFRNLSDMDLRLHRIRQ